MQFQPRTVVPLLASLSLFLGGSSCGPQLDETDEQTQLQSEALNAAQQGFGSSFALAELSSLSYRSNVIRSATDEGYRPGEVHETSSGEERYQIDVGHDAVRIDANRTLAPLVVEFRLPQAFSIRLRGNTGFLEGNESLLGFPPGPLAVDAVGAMRRELRLLNPALVLRDAFANPSKIVGVNRFGHHLALKVTDSVSPITLFINRFSGQIDSLQTKAVDVLRRDVEVEVRYQWSLGAGPQFIPEKVDMMYDGQLVRSETRSELRTNTQLDSAAFDFPSGPAASFDADLFALGERNHEWHQARASAGLRMPWAQPTVTPIELGDGVVFLAGGVHNSLAVEQDNGVVLIEAPVNEVRSAALSTFLAQRFPGKAVTHVIATHHHVDHSAGLRAFVASGATIVMGAPGVRSMRKAFQAPSSLEADALSRSRRQAHIISVESIERIGRGANTIEVRRVPNSHSEDMVIAYLPSKKLVFTSDLFTPGFAFQITEHVRSLHDAIVSQQLAVESIAGGHGIVGTMDELRGHL